MIHPQGSGVRVNDPREETQNTMQQVRILAIHARLEEVQAAALNNPVLRHSSGLSTQHRASQPCNTWTCQLGQCKLSNIGHRLEAI